MKNIIITSILFLITACAFAGNPIKEYIDNPSFSAVNYEAINLKTSDNYTLKSWVCMPDKKVDKKRVLVLAYGDSGNMSYWLRQVLEVVKGGYTVVMFDYRGYGQSQAFAVDGNRLYYDEFVIDLKAAVDYAKTRFGYKTGVWALSSGSIISTFLVQNNSVDFIIAEGFMVDPFDVKEKILKYTEREVTVPESATNYANLLSKISVPMLLFAGDRDGLTVVEDAYRVSYLNKQSKVVMFKGSHLQGFQALTGETHGQRYISALNDFCASILE